MKRPWLVAALGLIAAACSQDGDMLPDDDSAWTDDDSADDDTGDDDTSEEEEGGCDCYLAAERAPHGAALLATLTALFVARRRA